VALRCQGQEDLSVLNVVKFRKVVVNSKAQTNDFASFQRGVGDFEFRNKASAIADELLLAPIVIFGECTINLVLPEIVLVLIILSTFADATEGVLLKIKWLQPHERYQRGLGIYVYQ